MNLDVSNVIIIIIKNLRFIKISMNFILNLMNTFKFSYELLLYSYFNLFYHKLH